MKIYIQAVLIFGGLVASLCGFHRVAFWSMVPGFAWFLWDLFRQPTDGPRPQPRPPRRRC